MKKPHLADPAVNPPPAHEESHTYRLALVVVPTTCSQPVVACRPAAPVQPADETQGAAAAGDVVAWPSPEHRKLRRLASIVDMGTEVRSAYESVCSAHRPVGCVSGWDECLRRPLLHV